MSADIFSLEYYRQQRSAGLQAFREPEFWHHYCREQGDTVIGIEKGQSCNWCCLSEDQQTITRAAFIENTKDGRFMLIVDEGYEAYGTEHTHTVKTTYPSFAQALIASIRDYQIMDPFDQRGPDNEGYFG